MDIQATKLELVKKILEVNRESVLKKIKEILASETNSNPSEIVAYTTQGEPLTIEEYKAEIQKGLDDIEAGRFISHKDLLKEIENW